MDPIEALERVAYLQDRGLVSARKTAAFRRAAQVLRDLPPGELEGRLADGTLKSLPGIGPSTAEVAVQAAAGNVPRRIVELEESTAIPLEEGTELRAAVRGDCHTHSTWSDGGAEVHEMVAAARALGHQYMVITDHSARLTVAHGLDRDRLLDELDEIERLNDELDDFREDVHHLIEETRRWTRP